MAVLVVTVPIGLATSAGLHRAVSLGFYLLGSFFVVIGFFSGNRGPLRRIDHAGDWRRPRGVRRATREEVHESMAVSAIVIVIGLILLAIGVAVDSRYALL